MSNPTVHDLVDRAELEDFSGAVMFKAPVVAESNNRMAKQCMLYHLSIWLQKSDYRNFAILTKITTRENVFAPSARDTVIAFGDQSAYDDFMGFMDRLSAWFPPEQSMELNFIPHLPETGKHDLMFVKHPSAGMCPDTFEEVKKEVYELWTWIVLNCEKGAYRTPSGFAFIDEMDALKFKMFHG